MANFEQDYVFNCPYCAEEISVKFDLTGGNKQELVTDCEVCCHPIVIRVEIDEEEGVIEFSAEKES